MPQKPCVRCGDVLIVFEGAARLVWDHDGPRAPRGARVWPSRPERAEINDHLDRGDPLLVILEHEETTVPVLSEELVTNPAIAALAHFTGDVGEIDIPFLDWLPGPLQERGRNFLEHSRQAADLMPRAVRPPLLVGCPAPGAAPVRFARRLAPAPLSGPALEELVEYVFRPASPVASPNTAEEAAVVEFGAPGASAPC
ncbi:conserved protein of unknown function [Streptomyces murinus]|uniref:hypothetical protein n=1 Tax=Streptomyces murinus TaxID=33900 RepID=UPI003D6662D1